MGLFTNIFKKTEKLEPFDISCIKVDIHSHLIPGIDDGAQDMDQSIAMLNKFQTMGFKKVVTTPHVMTDSFPPIVFWNFGNWWFRDCCVG